MTASSPGLRRRPGAIGPDVGGGGGVAPGLPRRFALGVLGVLAVPFVALGLAQAWADAPTWDEGIYLASGVTALTRHELRVNPEHPPLAKVAAALPVLLARPVVPDTESYRTGRQFSYSAEFVRANENAGKLRRVVFLGRLVPLAEGVAVAFALYALAAGFFGRRAGVLAGGLWLTTPFFLGLAHVGTIDVPFTLATLVACSALARHLRRPGVGTAALVGLACGAALLVRATGLVLTPVLAVAAAWPVRHRLLRAAAHGAVVLAVAWAAVWGGVRALAPSPPGLGLGDLEVLVADAPGEVPWAGRAVAALPWPEEYATGLEYLAVVSSPPAPAFLLGRSWTGARWWYWPGSMAVKLPAGVLVVLAGGVFAWRRLPPGARRRAALAVVAPAAVLGAFTVAQPRPIGLRYLLPTLALGLVAASPVAGALRGRGARALGAALVATQALALASAHPHSLAWTAPPFRPAYRHVADANLDWSQDFWRLRAWAEQHPGAAPWVAYTSSSLSVADVPGARQLLGADPAQVRGWVAVFASLLTTYKRDELSWLRAYCPVGTIGGTVLLYFLDGPPDLSPGPSAPARPCPGLASRRPVA